MWLKHVMARFEGNLPLIIKALSVVILSMLSAVLVVYSMARPPAVAEVRLNDIMEHFIKQQGQSNLSPEAARKRSKRFSQALDKSIDNVAAHHHVLLVPSGAVLSSAPDLTHEVWQVLPDEVRAPHSKAGR